ncbi:MAG: RHS repeat-associated core domain-containing protein [Eubacterium sp.]|nr:RHS repeat-associated core domain-containing protein [Eubacterium sp.]
MQLYYPSHKGNKTSQNIIGPQENVIATIRYENDGQHAYFYNKDIRTSVTNVADESGRGVVSYRYDDYGMTNKYGDEDFYNELCYTSGVYDELTGLYYLNARYYNPGTATFITQDSYRGEQKDYGTWNLYAYCGGNPVNYVDPSGHIVMHIIGRYTTNWLAKKILNSPAYLGAELYLRKKKGWKYSADFLEHSLQSFPNDLEFDNKSDLAKKLKKHKKVKREVRRFRKTNKLASECHIDFNKGDLFGAFHRVRLKFDRFSGKITCKLIDKYDFKFEKKYLSITMFANNYAWYLQVKGASHKYNITVNMKFKDKKQKII